MNSWRSARSFSACGRSSSNCCVRTISDRRLADLDIAVVFSVSEHLPPEVKRDVAEHLGCWIVDVYGSVECGRMANSCPECGRFHVEAETVFVEVNGENGMLADVGDTGWVVATPLYNYAMPLIRYDHADRAVVGPLDGCSITLPTLQAVLGKERATFVLPGGVVIQPTVPPTAAVKYLGAQAFQVAQVAEDRCEFRIVPGRLAPSEMNFDEMTRLLKVHVVERVADRLQDRQRTSAQVRARKGGSGCTRVFSKRTGGPGYARTIREGLTAEVFTSPRDP